MFFEPGSSSPTTPKPKSRAGRNAKSKASPEPPFKLVTTRLRPATLSNELEQPMSDETSPPALSSTSLPFTAPVTEIALATLKFYSGSPESSARFEETIGHLIAAFAKSNAVETNGSQTADGSQCGSSLGEPQLKGLIGAAWGRVREREDQYVFVFGWETLEVCFPYFAGFQCWNLMNLSKFIGPRGSGALGVWQFDYHAATTVGRLGNRPC